VSGSPAWPSDGSARLSRSAWSLEAVDQVRAGDRFGFCTAVTPEFGPDPAEGEQRSVVVSANQMTSFLFVSGWLRRVFREAVEIHRADVGQKSHFVRLALVFSILISLSIFASPVLAFAVENPSISALLLLTAVLLLMSIFGIMGRHWISKRGDARQKQIDALSDATRLGEVTSAQRLLVIRAVDDEAYLVMALGTILAYIFTTSMAFAVAVLLLVPFIAATISFILFLLQRSPMDPDWFRHALTFGCSASVIAMFGALIVSRLVHGRELAKSPMDCQINTQSAPDSTGLKIVTLVSEKYVKWFGRHGIYEHDNCAKTISDWVRAQLGVQPDS
jgi:hypothetical protein